MIYIYTHTHTGSDHNALLPRSRSLLTLVRSLLTQVRTTMRFYPGGMATRCVPNVYLTCTQVRTTMRFYPGGMGGMGQSAADNVRDKGSTMDEWQIARNARVCMYVCLCVCMYARMHVCMYVCMYVYV
jgi:hypothetical protein